MTAYYNEIDEYAADWLRNLIAAGHIASGVVDTRSIEDVHPGDLRGFTQCHFFAGVGVWSYALRRSGWADDRPVWTGSCPCQPFSTAGKGAAFADERHLWPDFFHLIEKCKPATVFGEQVASRDADPWIDLVHTDMEALGYAFGCVPFPSAGVGAPHIRDRLYWVADAQCGAAERHGQPVARTPCGSGGEVRERPQRVRDDSGDGGHAGGLADASCKRRGETRECIGRPSQWSGHGSESRPTGPVNGLWRDADWLYCRDGKWRPVEPDTFPLANGTPARMGRLRAYGNAINAEAAIAFIEASGLVGAA